MRDELEYNFAIVERNASAIYFWNLCDCMYNKLAR